MKLLAATDPNSTDVLFSDAIRSIYYPNQQALDYQHNVSENLRMNSYMSQIQALNPLNAAARYTTTAPTTSQFMQREFYLPRARKHTFATST